MTNKQRKLKYIREKNRYRLGGSYYTYIIISNGMLEDDTFMNNEINKVIDKHLEHLENKYKMKFYCSEFIPKTQGCDYLNHTTTIKFKWKVKK